MNDRKAVKIIKKIMPAVVSIVISKHLEDVEREMPKELLATLPKGPDGKGQVPDEFVDVKGMVQVGGGSGFIVEPQGLILTNKHVVSEADAEYTVITSEGTKYPAHVITRDPINDVAILKIDGKKLPTLPLGDASRLELGEAVLAVGNALGMFKNTVSLGIVSGLSRSIEAQADPEAPPQELRGLVQTDAAINPGNSGGPLVNMNGKVVGINAAVVYGAQNISFAIPINSAKRDLNDLRHYGHIRRPFLGVRYVVVDEKLSQKLGLPVGYGAFVIPESPHDHGVIVDSPAAKAGVMEKDVILEINGQKIDRDHPIQDILENMKVGEALIMSILRAGKNLTLNVSLAERE